MIKDFCVNICQNKNLLMFITVTVYILGLAAALMDYQLVFAAILSVVLIFLILKECISPKFALILSFVFYLGIVNTTLRMREVDELSNLAPRNSTIYGKILSIPQNKNGDKIKFFFKVNKIEYDSIVKTFDNEKVLVTLNTTDNLKIYDSYKIKGRLAIPFKAGNPSQFDYGNYLRNFETYSVFYGKEFVNLQIAPTKKERTLQRINDYREKILAIHSNYLKSPNLEVLGGIVFGDDAVSPPEYIKKSFINSGLLHILAASGMNVAFIFSFFFFFLSLLKVNYKVNILFCILMVITYSLMTGLGASVVRATFMLVFVLIGKLIDRDAHSISLLAFVALIMLLYNPMYINDVGFQLSFVVTLGLLVMTPYLIRSKNKFLNWLVGTISIPIIAQLWVIPIQIFYFNNISIYSVFANIMSVPILSVISFGGFVSSLIAPITPHFVCQIFDFILNPMITLLVNISDFWGRLPFSTYQTTHPNIFQLFLYYLILLVLTVLLDKQKRSKSLMILLPSLIVILALTTISFPNKNLEITAFDVGNADAFLIKTPSDKYIMIDTAKSGYNGGKSQAEVVILKYMKDKGIKALDTLIVTHFDNDHCGGAVDLMQGLRVRRVYVNTLKHESIAAKNIYKTANIRNVELINALNGQNVYNEDGFRMTNYINSHSQTKGDNETSILTLVTYKEFSMLFTGDSGVDTFNNLKSDLPRNVTVLKVGHHGAVGVVNKEMADYFAPKYSLISVGENKFGHPSVLTLDFLNGTKILRTDINNSIRFVIGDKGLRVYTYDIRRRKYREYD